MSNRSGTAYSAPTDADRRPVVLGVSSADGITPLPLEISASSKGLLVDTNGLLAGVIYDYVGMSSPDGNGNYQTFVYKLGGSSGTVKATVSYTYDGSSNVTSITRT